MKNACQLAISCTALAALLAGFASHAAPTALAELPLKASVLAKPNVLVGFDDSGSMDAEIMLDTSDGMFWWNFTLNTYANAGWDSTGRFHRHINLGEYWSNTWRRYFYLFPNGNGAGRNIKPDAQYGDWALPPTSEFAWARSSDYNPQYYNPAVTYKPWAQAHGYGSFADATPTAARGHPVVNPTSYTFDLTATRAANTNTSHFFIAAPGMTLPAGASVSVCNNSYASCGSWTAVGASDTAAQNNRVTRLAMAYWPATYWIKATSAFDCTLPASGSVATRDCAAAPDGAKLRRIEIRPTNTSYPSGRTFEQERQNFANWFQYHRKRRLSANAGMGEVLENLTGLRIGTVLFNARPANGTRVTMLDLDNTNSANNGQAVLQTLYGIDTNSGTPTRETLNRIGHEFLQSNGPIQYACQRNAALIVTDGYASAVDVNPPSYSSSTYGNGAPYATTYGGTLADIALSYYTNRLGNTSFPTGKVPAGTSDPNTNLHMNTYALTLGAMGDLFRGENTPVPTTTGAWVDPNTDFNPSAIDDLWHATINGRGKMYLATAASETAAKLKSAFTSILSQTAAQGGVAVSAVNLDRGDGKAYLGVYDPSGWSGDLTANPIDSGTATINTTPTWRAATVLGARAWTSRLIFSSSGSAGVDFDVANVGAAVNPDIASFSNSAVVEYLRGNRAGEGTTFRQRTSLIGAVVNAEPVLARQERVAFLASGDGMLHAFDTLDGSEQWAYVPPDQLGRLGQSVRRSWVYQTLLDATPAHARLSTGNKLLVGGLGAAGRSYYALDVSSPRNLTAEQARNQFRWIFPATTDTSNRNLMGYTTGKPVITRTAADGDVVLVTSGYDNGQSIGDGKGRLWMLRASDGAVLKTFRTTAGAVGSESGLAHVAAFKESDGNTRWVYGGDLLGNVWRFDLATAGAGEHDGFLVATLRDSSGNAQPVTAVPELALVSGKRVVLVGTGRILDVGDFGSTRTQSFYAIDGDVTTTLNNARTSLVAQTYSASGDTITTNTVNWATGRGWYVDLPAGEQANTDPVVAFGAVAFATNVNGGSDCSEKSYMYLLNIGTGSRSSDVTYVRQLISDTATSSRLLALGTDGAASGTLSVHYRSQLSNATIYQPAGRQIGAVPPGKNAWREVRR